MKEKALVSVIMPAYNSAKFIEEAIASVQRQTFTNWELLVIDDASTDSTASKIRGLSEGDFRIKIFQNESNRGAGVSRNRGIRAAKGDFIAFLDADDLWKPKKLEIQLEFMQKNHLMVCYSSYERISEKGEDRKEIVEALPFLTYDKLLKSNYIGNLTGIYNARKLGRIYASHIRKRQDWGLWLEAVKRGGTAKGVKEPLAVYRVRKDSVSGNKMEMLKYNFNVYHKILGFGWLKSFRCMLVFLKEHFLVKTRQLKKLQHGGKLL